MKASKFELKVLKALFPFDTEDEKFWFCQLEFGGCVANAPPPNRDIANF